MAGFNIGGKQMKYVIKQVEDWKKSGSKKSLNTFQLDNNDYSEYSSKLFGFSHGTNCENLRKILDSGKINSSFNVRQAQIACGLNTTGGDRGHDGQYTVYFRFVEKEGSESDKDTPKAIIRSLGGVGGGSGCVLFVSLKKIVQSKICFALAGSSDGLKGSNSFTKEKLERAKESFEKRRSSSKEDFDPVFYGKKQFEFGLNAAQMNARSNEIGFFDSVPLENIEIIMIRGEGIETIPNYSLAGMFTKNRSCKWKVFLRNGSNLDLGFETPLPPLKSARPSPSVCRSTASSSTPTTLKPQPKHNLSSSSLRKKSTAAPPITTPSTSVKKSSGTQGRVWRVGRK